MEELSLVSTPEGGCPMKLKERPVLGGDLKGVGYSHFSCG